MPNNVKLTKELLRERMPLVSQVVDRFRQEFGSGIKVLWAKENGVEVGSIPVCRSVTPDCYVEPDYKPKKRS